MSMDYLKVLAFQQSIYELMSVVNIIKVLKFDHNTIFNALMSIVNRKRVSIRKPNKKLLMFMVSIKRDVYM